MSKRSNAKCLNNDRSASSSNDIHNHRHWTTQFGYPCKQINNVDEIYNFILNQATIDDGKDSGISSEDLALVLQRPIEEILHLIHELQVSGQIYQNENGLFVPL